MKVDSFEYKMIEYKDIASFLFNLLDDIDTLDDACKGDNKAFRERVYEIQQKRFEVADTNGYELKFKVFGFVPFPKPRWNANPEPSPLNNSNEFESKNEDA